MKFADKLLEDVADLQKLIDVEITRRWYGERVEI